MNGTVAFGTSSPHRTMVDIWLKWSLVDSPAIASIVAAVRSGTMVDRNAVPDGDRLVSALAALADGDRGRAARLLAKASETPWTVTARADILALQGNWAAAIPLYHRAVVLDGTDPIALLGTAVAAVAERRAATAEQVVRSVREMIGDGPVLRHYLVLALVCRAGEVCAVSRDGQPVITSTAQLAECERIAADLAGSPVDDDGLASSAAALVEQVTTSRAWRWRRRGANTGILIVLLLVCSIGALVTASGGDLSLAIGALVVGGGTVFLYVVTNRRPAWELHALGMAHMITAPVAPTRDVGSG